MCRGFNLSSDIQRFSEADFANMKGFADEPTLNQFVESIGGQRLDKRHPNLTFPNADYIFDKDKVIIELKILETEFGKTDQFREKLRIVNARQIKKHGKTPLSLDPKVALDYIKEFVELFRAPIARIIKKANSQLRETKVQLGYDDYEGVLLLVNDGFRELPPRPMMATMARILNGAYTSVSAAIYLTNHFVIAPGDEYGRIMWVPMYSDTASDKLSPFINDLGRQWFDYCKSRGLLDDHVEGPDVPLTGYRAAGTSFPIT